MQEDSVTRSQRKCAEKVDNRLLSLMGDTIIERVHRGGGTLKRRRCWLRVQRLPIPRVQYIEEKGGGGWVSSDAAAKRQVAH